MKDGLGTAAVGRIANALGELHGDFESSQFIEEAMNGMDKLELKERVDHLIGVLNNFLPSKFSDAANILMRLPNVWDRGDPDDPLKGFAMWPLTDYVAAYGMQAPKKSLQVMEKLTPLFSAEFAIRPFIEQHPKITFEFLEKWLKSPDEHLRRLVSEGTRPRLPWGMQLKSFIQDPAPILPLLEALRLDESQYVRRSVANNLNDIGKDHPDLLIKVCKRWQKKNKDKTEWVISHATRSLVKSGHPGVFVLLGYDERPAVKVADLTIKNKKIRFGGEVNFSLTLKGAKDNQKCVVDYAVHYIKANGSAAPKVFKLKNIQIDKDETQEIQRKISFKSITTRKYYAGEHVIAIHINGEEVARSSFQLSE